MKEWLSEQVDGLVKGGEMRKSQFREHGKDEHWHHCESNEGNLENKALYVSCTKKNKNNNTMADRVCPCYCCFECVCPSQTIRRGKHCDISRPSYSNQKIKVPFFPSCPLLDAVTTKP